MKFGVITFPGSNCALENIAGVTNKGKIVFGMMPLPEIVADLNLSNVDAESIFKWLLGLVKT